MKKLGMFLVLGVLGVLRLGVATASADTRPLEMKQLVDGGANNCN
jgi:hypothetical protein